jgi:C_GCAxxG_C_C family probable redox protein
MSENLVFPDILFYSESFTFKEKIKMKRSKEDKAIESFREGLNCAQTVVTSFSDDLNFDRSSAEIISCGFGGGMGRLGETCGAVTGSYMTLGIFNCAKFADNASRKEATYAMVQEFSRKFKQIHGTTDCKSLLKCDLNTQEGHSYAKENNLFGTVCEKCIKDSIAIVNELIKTN